MKKLLLSTIVLLAFSIALIIFQISCTKKAISQPTTYVLMPATTSKLGGVMPDGTTIAVDATGKISTVNGAATQEGKLLYGVYGTTDAGNAIWISNYDGSNAQKINITVPTGYAIDLSNLTISPDHKTIFFALFSTGTATSSYLGSCNIDGTNQRQVQKEGPNGTTIGAAF